jgi:hypothetical protein
MAISPKVYATLFYWDSVNKPWFNNHPGWGENADTVGLAECLEDGLLCRHDGSYLPTTRGGKAIDDYFRDVVARIKSGTYLQQETR